VEHLMAAIAGIPKVKILTPTDPALRAAMVTFHIDGIPSGKVFGHLMEMNRLRCRPVDEAGLDATRVSFHVFNTFEQAELVAAALARLTRT